MGATAKSPNAAERSQSLQRVVDVLESQRLRIDRFLADHQVRLAELETRFLGEVEIISNRCQDWQEFQGEVSQSYLLVRQEREAVERQQRELSTRARELDQLQQETENQRRRVAQKLDERRRKLAADQTQSRWEQIRRIEELEAQLAKCNQDAALQAAEYRSARAEMEQYLETIQKLEQQLANATPSQATQSADHQEAFADLEARYEMAMQSLEALREKNDQLEEELSRCQEADVQHSTFTSDVSSPMAEIDSDWEATKRRLLARLDGDQLDSSEQEHIEATIRRTDDYMAEKDRELAELREQLDALVKSGSADAQASADMVHEQILDQDQIIAAERARLAELQAEWHEKMRQAEVECAKERAQNARLRSELQEKLRDVEAELKKARGAANESGSAKRSGRRWLDHLGIQKDDP